MKDMGKAEGKGRVWEDLVLRAPNKGKGRKGGKATRRVVVNTDAVPFCSPKAEVGTLSEKGGEWDN